MVRPTFAYKASLRLPTKHDYTKMLMACVEAVLAGKPEITLVVSHLTRFPADFPKGIVFKREMPLIWRRIKANRLINWLNNHGYSQVTMEDLRVEQRKVTLLEKGTLLEKELLNDEFLSQEG